MKTPDEQTIKLCDELIKKYNRCDKTVWGNKYINRLKM